jgi:hypothetical protein
VHRNIGVAVQDRSLDLFDKDSLAAQLSEWTMAIAVPERVYEHENTRSPGSRLDLRGDVFGLDPSLRARTRGKAQGGRHAPQRIAAPSAPVRGPRRRVLEKLVDHSTS